MKPLELMCPSHAAFTLRALFYDQIKKWVSEEVYKISNLTYNNWRLICFKIQVLHQLQASG